MRAFTYDPPVISFHPRFNIASSVGTAITLFGLNFGSEDYSPSVHIGDSMCTTTTWASTTKLACVARDGVGIFYGWHIATTVSSVASTKYMTFTFDAPVASYVLLPNAAMTGGWFMTVNGLGFHSRDSTASIRIGETKCNSATWSSSTSVLCDHTLPSVGRNTHRILVIIGRNTHRILVIVGRNTYRILVIHI